VTRDILVVCGLKVEARIAKGRGVRICIGGGRSEVLIAAIEREIASGVDGIVSFGLCGALVPALAPGTLIVAQSTIYAGRSLGVEARWSELIEKRMPYASRASLAGSDRIVMDAVAKQRLHEETGAAAVDMESHIAAAIAGRHGVPFVALRAVADPFLRPLPPAAMVAMQPGGGIDFFAVLRAVAKNPGQLPALLAIGRDTRRGLSALRRGRRLAGARFGYADLDQLLVNVV
jgi:hopanoid-associated phosphorylase